MRAAPKMGAPSKLTPAALKRARELSEAGCTDAEIALGIGIARGTLYRWKSENRDFYDAVEIPKARLDDKVEAAAFAQAAGGVLHEGTADEKRIDPVPMMTKWWLANRRPGRWKEKQVDVGGQLEVGITDEARDAINVLGIVAKAQQAAGQVVEGELVEDPVQAEPLRPPKPAVKAPARPKQPGAGRVAPPPKPRAR